MTHQPRFAAEEECREAFEKIQRKPVIRWRHSDRDAHGRGWHVRPSGVEHGDPLTRYCVPGAMEQAALELDLNLLAIDAILIRSAHIKL